MNDNDQLKAGTRARRAMRLLQPFEPERVNRALADCHHLSARMMARESTPAAKEQVALALQTGRETLANLVSGRRDPQSLDDTEVQGLEAVVLAVGRPALLIRGGHFDAAPEPWSVLEQYRSRIEALFQSVGRIELSGHPSLDWVGTGFLVAPGVLATNRHVIQEFSQPDGQGRWSIEAGISVRVDFAEELGSTTPREYPVHAILGVHTSLDVALLEVGGRPAPALQLDGGNVPLDRGQRGYVIGFPALDSRRNDATTMQRIFADIYNVKRLQPGLLTDWSSSVNAYLHDCSTLGGNSGSCLVDLASGVVVGIHFGGRFGEANWALSTRDLAGAPLLQRLGASFV